MTALALLFLAASPRSPAHGVGARRRPAVPAPVSLP